MSGPSFREFFGLTDEEAEAFITASERAASGEYRGLTPLPSSNVHTNMMDNMYINDDSTAYFLSEDQDLGVVIHEEEGETLRIGGEQVTFDQIEVAYYISQNEPVTRENLHEEFDADDWRVDDVLDKLHDAGQVYQPTEGEFRLVNNALED